ncbi:hypothetical protein FRC04_005985 [Tulasnella sp. 424]|nr:hypothetical protein FRC04_005985 [Tulasnella sp. 424]
MSTILMAVMSNPSTAASHLLPGVEGFAQDIDTTQINAPKQVVVQTVANQENAFQFVTPRPLRRSITRLRGIFILRTLSIPLFFGTAPALAYAFGAGQEVDWPNLAILVTLCFSTVLHPVAAWYTYHLGERVKVKDFMADYLGSNRAFEMKLAIAATVAGVAAITSSLSIMVALAVTWVATVSWNAARTAKNTLFPTTWELEKSLVELANNLNDVDSERNQTSNSPSVLDGPCKACCGPIRVVEKSQVLDPPDTEFSRSFSQAFDEAVKRELVKRREANAEYD